MKVYLNQIKCRKLWFFHCSANERCSSE